MVKKPVDKSMMTQKTYQDFNGKEPSLSDPNESKGKKNPHRPNLADEAKNTKAGKTKVYKRTK